MKYLITIGLALALSACGTTVGHAAREKTSTFDGSRSVWIDAHGTNCGMSMVCDGVGAEWLSTAKDLALLDIEFYGDYRNITGAELNIDGQIIQLNHQDPAGTDFRNDSTDYSNPGLTEMERVSQQRFTVPLSLIRRIEASHSVKLRLYLDHLTVDSIIIDGDKTSKAYYALGRFLAKVDQDQTTAPSGG